MMFIKYALSFYGSKNILDYRNQFGRVPIVLDGPNLFWSGPNHCGQIQIIEISPEKIWFGSDQNDLEPNKTIWTVQNHFGPIEGQGIRIFVHKRRLQWRSGLDGGQKLDKIGQPNWWICYMIKKLGTGVSKMPFMEGPLSKQRLLRSWKMCQQFLIEFLYRNQWYFGCFIWKALKGFCSKS